MTNELTLKNANCQAGRDWSETLNMNEAGYLVTEGFLSRRYGISTERLKAGIDFYARFFAGETRWQDWVYQNLAIDGNLDILDLGSGTGELWLIDGKPRRVEGHVTLVDRSEAMAEECRRVFAYEKAFSVVCDSAEAILQSPSQYDRVVAAHVIYHIAEPSSFAAACTRKIRRNGLLCVTCVGSDHLQLLLDELSRFALVHGLSLRPRRIPFGSPDGLKSLFQESNANVEVLHYRASLVVTEAQPLVNYVLSMDFFDDIQPGFDLGAELTGYFDRLIARKLKLTLEIHNLLAIFRHCN